MLRCVLIGNYGVGNVGDEALKEYFLQEFTEVEWTVLEGGSTRHPLPATRRYKVLPHLPLGFRSFFRPWWKTFAALYRADHVIYGGGSLFTDNESIVACMVWWWHALWCRILGRPYHLSFQGVGPFESRLGEWFARNAFRHAASISVRDEESMKRVQQWSSARSSQPAASFTFDPAFAYFASFKRSAGTETLVLIPRTNSNRIYMDAARLAAGSHSWKDIRILLMQPTPAEHVTAGTVRSSIQFKGEVRIVEAIDIPSLMNNLADAALVVSQRFHGALAALAMQIPVAPVPLSPGDKLAGLEPLVKDPSTRAGLLKRIDDGKNALKSALGLS